MRVDDMIITTAYFSIPLQILYSLFRYPRLSRMPLHLLLLLVLFALFIFLCGAGHLLRGLGYAGSDVFAALNWCTAFISLSTALYLLPLVPNLMSSLDANLQDLIRLNEETDEARRKLVTFMGFLCHEIRNPLFAVTSFCSFLEDELLTPSQTRALASIQQSTNLMLRLVNDVLDISKLESGKLELEEQEFLLREMLQNVATSTEMQLRTKPEISFKFTLAPNVPSVVSGDSVRILQIAYNLLSNAAKFTDEGTIEFKASVIDYEEALEKSWINSTHAIGLVIDGDKTTAIPCSESTLYDSTSDSSEFAMRLLLDAEEGSVGLPPKDGSNVIVLKIEVADTGDGIGQDLLERIFVPYSQSKLSVYRKHGGTGLGLAILAKLSRKMGGTIHVASKEGVGSTFAVYIQVRVPSTPTDVQHDESTEKVMEFQRNLAMFPDMIPLRRRSSLDRDGAALKLSHHRDDSIERLHSSISSTGASLHEASNKPLQYLHTGSTGSLKEPRLDLFAAMGPIKQKVLVVDDNLMNRKLLGRMLSQFNLEYEVAEDGQVAVDIMLKSRNVTGRLDAPQFGLILMDLSMPRLDGCAATRILRGCNVEIPIIALTACAVDESKVVAMEAGVTEFLLKPILRGDLYNKCKFYLGEDKPERVQSV